MRRKSSDIERCVGTTIERNCTGCGQWKLTARFGPIQRADGTVGKEARCYDCRRTDRKTSRMQPILDRWAAKLAKYPRTEVLAWLESTQLRLSNGL